MTASGWAAAFIFLFPTLLMSAVWAVGHQRFGRPAPVRVRQPTVILIPVRR